MRRVVCVFLPSWPVDRWRRQDCGALDSRPLLVAGREGGRRVVVAADAAAMALGLHVGMAVAQAQAMVPGLRVEEARPGEDAAGLVRLAGWCLRHFSPLAAVCPPDGVWMDVTGCAHLFGGEAGLLEAVTQRLAGAGICARAAVADTAGAAHACAKYGVGGVVAPGGARAALAGLPVASLRLAPEAVGALRVLGFDTVGQLMAAPRAPLARRFGGVVLRRLDQALGGVCEPIQPVAVQELPRARLGFPEPIATAEDLARAAGLLADRLCEKLSRLGLGACRLDLIFQRVDGVHQAIRVGTAQATRDSGHLVRLLVPGIEGVDPGFGIEAMMLTASLTARLAARQSLSELCAPEAGGDFAALVDVLASRLGVDRVFRVGPVQSDVPERSVRAIPAIARAKEGQAGGAGWPARLPRPARLLTPPARIEAMALLPDRAPASFTWRRRAHRVRRADGPERIFGEWWRADGEMWAVRDYFAVEDEAGQRFWLFRKGDGEDAATGDLTWFLHGIFG